MDICLDFAGKVPSISGMKDVQPTDLDGSSTSPSNAEYETIQSPIQEQ